MEATDKRTNKDVTTYEAREGGVNELERRGEARWWEKSSAQKNAECSECVSQLSFPSFLPPSLLPSLPSFSLRYPPSPPLFSFPLPVSSVLSARPPVYFY